jgi:hypothetical protein
VLAVEEELRQFLQLLEVAVSNVTEQYFQLPVADADTIYRERVYCYELYHQLRCIWDDFPFSLGGEVDKVGHPHFRNGPYARAKPDLLVHVPGEMARNLASIEVKSVTARVEELTDDLKKLTWFCHHAKYFRGILLIYGDGGDIERVHDRLRRGLDGSVDVTALISLYHRSMGQRPELIGI